MPSQAGTPDLSLSELGWAEFFEGQISDDERALVPLRIASVHRSRLSGLGTNGPAPIVLPPKTSTGDFAVGDFVLVEARTALFQRRLSRHTVLERRTEGGPTPQLAAANVDTLFIATSCNADFNPARLERYLALANQAGTTPVILLTKVDTIPDASSFVERAKALQTDLEVVTLNSRSAEAAAALAPWCGMGRTVALVGSSGVGKSTLVNTLAGGAIERPQETGGIRESDAKGRHTTTARSLHRIAAGGWVIDTPGMRTLHVSDAAEGIDRLFSEITELAPLCRFRDCTHAHEPGCAVLAAVADGRLDAERLGRWRKLLDENRDRTPDPSPRGQVAPGARGRKR
ncbi:MAG: ribosome small subunit-dependent GTPase A [Rhizobiaceae bacterium]|nr:ribosome small subunit-dependent GTPase A [Rhizobiaceae bacterium]